ncbi:MAG TPA: hypothetical protein DCX03_00730 [Bacteroidales bacterium]|nr:hypothetical protein [Bacteroidales bacterium]
MSPVISIIIPVYNVEKYIHKCLQSLLDQTFSDFEVIIVDDGSPDNSISVAKQIVAGDSRFVFYEKDNEGQGAARNFGFDFSKGKYIAFLDSDDYYDITFLEKMYNKIISEDADICICDIDLVREDGTSIKVHRSAYHSSISGKTAFVDNLNMQSLLSLPQNKLIKRNVFEKNKFPVGYFYEDKATAYKHFYFAEKLVFVNEALFYYVQRSGSTTNSFKLKRIDDRFTVLENIKDFLISENIADEYSSEYITCYLIYLPLSGGTQIAMYANDKYGLINDLENRLDKEIYNLKNILKLRKTHLKKMLGLLLFKYCKPLFIRMAIREKAKNF